ncbi:MAG: hypothetical protein QM504_09175 [Pseudomonadota bacterium]
MIEEEIKKDCWDKRFYSFGTAKIFEQRARQLYTKRQWIVFLGLLSPVTIGAFVASFSINSEALKTYIIPIAGTVAVIQAVLSIWSLVMKWDERYSYAISAIKINTNITSEFEALAKTKPTYIKNNIKRMNEIYLRQEIEDSSQHITDKEKRYAMRHALFQYKNECKTCLKIPSSLSPTTCDTCGNF